MARFTRIQVANKMTTQGMVPLFYHEEERDDPITNRVKEALNLIENLKKELGV